MDRKNVKSLCRICLQEGATCPIFDGIKKENSINSKLRECLKVKVEDVEGYPRSICISCNNTLDTVYEFIEKFRKTCKILENGLCCKQENDDNEISDFETDQIKEIEIDINNIKCDPNICLKTVNNTAEFIDLLKPLEDITKQIKKESFQSTRIVNKTSRNKYKIRTDKVASSILEGEFAWTGETWCLKTSQLKVLKQKGVKAKRRDTRLKLPKIPTVKQPKLCDVCGDTFRCQSKLTLHRKKIHFNNPRKCSLCTRICSSERNLVRHIKRKHSTDKEFTCATCGGRFAYASELRNHISKVHNKKPKPALKCKFCDKTYVTQKSVIIHERSAHTGERPAECSVCSKGFFHEDYLKEHMRLHTGEAPFKCPICDRGYAQRGNMKSHLRIHRISELDARTLSKIKPNYLKLLKV